MTEETRYCLQCDEKRILSEMVLTKKDLTAKVGDKSIVVPDVLGHHCPACGECEFPEGEGKRFSEVVEKLRAAKE